MTAYRDRRGISARTSTPDGGEGATSCPSHWYLMNGSLGMPWSKSECSTDEQRPLSLPGIEAQNAPCTA